MAKALSKAISMIHVPSAALLALIRPQRRQVRRIMSIEWWGFIFEILGATWRQLGGKFGAFCWGPMTKALSMIRGLSAAFLALIRPQRRQVKKLMTIKWWGNV